MTKFPGNREGVKGVYCYTGKKEEDMKKAECPSGACYISVAIGQVFKTRMSRIYFILHLFFSDGVTHPPWRKHEGRGCLLPFLRGLCQDFAISPNGFACTKARRLSKEVGHDIKRFSQSFSELCVKFRVASTSTAQI